MSTYRNNNTLNDTDNRNDENYQNPNNKNLYQDLINDMNDSDALYDGEFPESDNEALNTAHSTTNTSTAFGYEDGEPLITNSNPGFGQKRPNKSHTILSEIFSYIKIIVVAILIAFVFTQFIIVNAQVPTGSMKDTIMEGDRLIGFRLSYTFSKPERGDIVIFKFPDDETQNYVKRVIGIPGDVIQIADGQVTVNGEVQQEDYIREAMIDNGVTQTYVVPEGHYFMMGDNRNNSADSRYWVNTYVAEDKILAKVIFRYYSGSEHRPDFKIVQ